MKKNFLTVVALSMLLFATTAHASIIGNGSFDNGLDGWTSGLLGGPEWDTQNQAALFEHNSFQLVNQSLFQTFRIAPGTESLELSFDLTIKKSNFYAALSSFSVTFNSFDLGFKDFSFFNWNSVDDDSMSATITKTLDFNLLIDLPANAAIFFNFAATSGLGNASVLLDNVMLGTVSPPAVPVPAAVWLMGTGLAGLVALRRKNAA